MTRTDYPSPSAEMAKINRMQYEIDYTEGISQRMRVPEQLKVAPGNSASNPNAHPNLSVPGPFMQVPERIVVAGQSEEALFSRPSDLDLIQTTPFELLALKTPPRVLTLSERPLDFLDLERPTPVTPQQEELRSIGRLKRERSASENMARQNGQLIRHDSLGSQTCPQDPPPRQVCRITEAQHSPTTPAPTGRPCPAPVLPADGADLFTARGILSLIQTSTRRAYQQVIDVLDENRRPILRGGSPASATHHDNARTTVSTLDSTMELMPDDMNSVDATSLRRQIIKLNRRLLLLEEENKERQERKRVGHGGAILYIRVQCR
uniref:Mitochondrial fission factor n=1 Tax=Leptobrachium leishanense TaxID=445787 RepID=A0A8C5QIE4_9ANUR